VRIRPRGMARPIGWLPVQATLTMES